MRCSLFTAVTLHSSSPVTELGAIQIMIGTQSTKLVHLPGQSTWPLLITLSKCTLLHMLGLVDSGDLQLVLVEFEDVFQSPKELPPHRLQDHHIPFKDENVLVKADHIGILL
ncbi:hypothetical protein J1N35_000620 [Gossypium stocksii]|uniref:Uncharacterized protein n=1 Tax=Gossypium stocksii TaxID=47602 RepID=A0A9D4AK93_9ROSI|nr:hypothetical protein J1N35_000620 [Gossypium stocksii]